MNIEVLKFSATWCGPCRALSQILKGVEGITNVDIDQNRELAAKHNVRSVPLLVFKLDDEEVYRHSGTLTKSMYEKILNNIKSKN